jgi:arsenate reductase (glutaredoxin)
MSQTIIYHNPRCSKSRQTLQLLQDNNIDPQVVEYLKETPGVEELDVILTKLNLEPNQIVRKKEDAYRQLGLANKSLTRQEYLKILVANPVLIERPIVVKGNKAALGRPPENVLEIL